MLWIIIFALIALCGAASIAFLVTRFARFEFMRKLAGEKKKRRIGFSILTVVLLVAAVMLLFGWMNTIIVMLHLVLLWLLCDLVQWLIGKVRHRPLQHYYAGVLAILLTIGYLSVGWYQAHHVWQTNYTVATEKQVGDLRIVQLADAHIGSTFSGTEFGRYVDEISALNPDIVVITGDFIDDDTSLSDMNDACAQLGRLKTTYGVYFVFGNHDDGYMPGLRGYDGETLVAALESNHVTVLKDESVLIDNRFYIVGREDRSVADRADIGTLMQGLDKDKFSIVLDHQPHDYDNEAAAGADLVLSGHTHGGQMIPINSVGYWIGENAATYGLEKRRDTVFIVTSGISDWAIDFKTGCKSEYVVIDLQGKP